MIPKEKDSDVKARESLGSILAACVILQNIELLGVALEELQAVDKLMWDIVDYEDEPPWKLN